MLWSDEMCAHQALLCYTTSPLQLQLLLRPYPAVVVVVIRWSCCSAERRTFSERLPEEREEQQREQESKRASDRRLQLEQQQPSRSCAVSDSAEARPLLASAATLAVAVLQFACTSLASADPVAVSQL